MLINSLYITHLESAQRIWGRFWSRYENLLTPKQLAFKASQPEIESFVVKQIRPEAEFRKIRINPYSRTFNDTITHFMNANPNSDNTIEVAEYDWFTDQLRDCLAKGGIPADFSNPTYPLHFMTLFLKGKLNRQQITTLLQLSEICQDYQKRILAHPLLNQDGSLSKEFLRSFVPLYNQNLPKNVKKVEDREIMHKHLDTLRWLIQCFPPSERYFFVSSAEDYRYTFLKPYSQKCLDGELHTVHRSLEDYMQSFGHLMVDMKASQFVWPSCSLSEAIGLAIYGEENWVPCLHMLGRELKPGEWGLSIDDIWHAFDKNYRSTTVAYPGTQPFGKVHLDDPSFARAQDPSYTNTSVAGFSNHMPAKNAALRAHDYYHRMRLVSIPYQLRQLLKFSVVRTRELYQDTKITVANSRRPYQKKKGLAWSKSLWKLVDAEYWSRFYNMALVDTVSIVGQGATYSLFYLMSLTLKNGNNERLATASNLFFKSLVSNQTEGRSQITNLGISLFADMVKNYSLWKAQGFRYEEIERFQASYGFFSKHPVIDIAGCFRQLKEMKDDQWLEGDHQDIIVKFRVFAAIQKMFTPTYHRFIMMNTTPLEPILNFFRENHCDYFGLKYTTFSLQCYMEDYICPALLVLLALERSLFISDIMQLNTTINDIRNNLFNTDLTIPVRGERRPEMLMKVLWSCLYALTTLLQRLTNYIDEIELFPGHNFKTYGSVAKDYIAVDYKIIFVYLKHANQLTEQLITAMHDADGQILLYQYYAWLLKVIAPLCQKYYAQDWEQVKSNAQKWQSLLRVKLKPS
jgi:hypothetical protein